MKPITFNQPHPPVGREAQRNQEHRRMAGDIDANFAEVDADLEAVLKLVNQLAAKNGLTAVTRGGK